MNSESAGSLIRSLKSMFTFQRTTDLATVKRILTHPAIYPFISDDSCPPVESFEPVAHPGFRYMLAYDDQELLGLWLFCPVTGCCYETHTCLLPQAWGRRAVAAAREMAEWIWANTQALRIITSVPSNNKRALWFAKRAGMQVFGRNPSAWKKDGHVYDIILLGMTRPEAV